VTRNQAEREDIAAGFAGRHPATAVTQFYGAGSVYCLTPTTEEIARRLGEQLRPQPVARYELEPAPSATANVPDTEPPW
jgi:hypothetical protein